MTRIGLVLTVWLVIVSGIPATSIRMRGECEWIAQAQACERRGEWAAAARHYRQSIIREGSNTDTWAALQNCWRRDEQVRRLANRDYRKHAESMSVADALAVATESLQRLQTLYWDRRQVTMPILFRHGLTELRHLAEQSELGTLGPVVDSWPLNELPSDLAMTKDALRKIANEARRLDLPAALVVLEFAAGMCAGLDEMTRLRLELGKDTPEFAADAIPDAELIDDVGQPERRGLAYLRVAHFDPRTIRELDSELLRLRMVSVRGLILDLRGNPGGVLSSAIAAAERFLPRGLIVTTRGQVGMNRSLSSSGVAAVDWPLVVLVDCNTASAAEVFVAALRDHDRAVIVGQTTFGKGSLQQTISLEAGGALQLTMARLYSPAGKSFHHLGIVPHVVEHSPDRQFEAAIEQLVKRLNGAE